MRCGAVFICDEIPVYVLRDLIVAAPFCSEWQAKQVAANGKSEVWRAVPHDEDRRELARTVNKDSGGGLWHSAIKASILRI